MSATLELHLDAHELALRGMTLPEALDYAAAQWGERLALHEIEGEHRSLTWSEFREHVEHLRSGLEASGVAPGDKVGILLRNGIDFPVAWFAVMGAGAAIVPLNPKYTAKEIDFVLSDAGATWLIGLGELLDQHAEGGKIGPVAAPNLIAVGDCEVAGLSYADLLHTAATPRGHRAEPMDVTNVQFTSGTTGLPKGCLLSHQYWLELGVMSSALSDSPQRLLADHPFYYMQNQAYLSTALASGGALYITPGLSLRKFMGWLYDYQIDFAWIGEEMLDFPASDLDHQLAITYAPVAGLPVEAYAPLRERFGIRGRESYASTELGSAIAVPHEREDMVGTGSMGLCLPNRESKVIDDRLNEVPVGTPGELCVRGTGIMLGYHNRPEANAELFLEGGWFRTGDVVIKTDDGQHFFVGRVRDMIRRSGENISALEVEMHLIAMPGVDDVAVIGVPDAQRDEEVKAIIVRGDDAVTADAIMAWAAEGLAPFKRPRYIEFREELPYTGSGKIAKGELRKQDPFPAGIIDTRA